MVKLLRNEEGSSSVLIVVMMVVLIVFGLAIFSTALSNMRLADKKIAWKNEYYQLESKSNRIIGDIITVIEDINNKKTDRTSGFATIDQMLSDSCSEHDIARSADGNPSEITLNVTNENGDKNIAITLVLSQDQQTNGLSVRITKFKEWQKHFDIDDSSPFSKCPAALTDITI